MKDWQEQDGILLKKLPYAESDEIIVALLKSSGVKRFYARSSRKSQKRFGGQLDHFAKLKFVYRERSEGLWSLNEVSSLIDQERPWENHIEVYAFLSFLAEMIQEFSPDEMEDERLFHLWEQSVQELSQNSDENQVHVFAHLTHAFLEVFGFASHGDFKTMTDIIDYTHSVLEKPLKSSDFLINSMNLRL